jgi:Domain of unknown function (DUF1902)
MKEINVTAEWHDEAKVWIATSEDIWGLAAQAADFETLRKKVLPMIEDLVELNKVPLEGVNIPIHFIAKSTSTLMLKSVA